ncbi:MAG: flavin reductase [Streptosporangiales bacterium]|nr:flavin reductase [Streptosporangiales bacterium]
MSPETFRSAMARLAGAVTLVTARHEGADVGMTATAFLPVSAEPPLVLVSVGRPARMHRVLRATSYWGVSLLARHQRDLAANFARPSADDDGTRFDGLPLLRGPHTGVSLVDGALARFECRTYRMVDAGDHILIVGAVLGVDLASGGEPLLYFERDYRTLS